MVTVNIDIKNSLVSFKEFKYSHDAIVGVTEAISFELFRMVEPTCPVDAYFSVALSDKLRGYESSCSLPLTVIIHVVENRTVSILREEALYLVLEVYLLFYRNVFEAINIVVCME